MVRTAWCDPEKIKKDGERKQKIKRGLSLHQKRQKNWVDPTKDLSYKKNRTERKWKIKQHTELRAKQLKQAQRNSRPRISFKEKKKLKRKMKQEEKQRNRTRNNRNNGVKIE